VSAKYKFWAFISYSNQDRRRARWLRKKLEGYRIPKDLIRSRGKAGEPIPKTLKPIFRDRDELPGSADLGQVIKRALSDSRSLIVICSPHAASSRWVNSEILEFKALGKSHNVLALIVDGEPNASINPSKLSRSRECFPEALRHPLGSDGRLDQSISMEPLAVDLRPGQDGRARAIVRLVAGVAGIDFDKLYRRHDRARRRRNAVMGLFATSLTIVFALLAIVAIRQRNLAQEMTVDALNNLGTSLLQRGAPVEALDELTKAHNICTATRPEDKSCAHVSYNLGTAYLELEKFSVALEYFTDARKYQQSMKSESRMDSEFLQRIYQNLCYTHIRIADTTENSTVRSKHYNKAEAFLDKARSSMLSSGQDPNLLPFSAALTGRLYIGRGQFQDAINVLEQAQRAFAKDPTIQILLATAYQCLDRYDEAFDMLKKHHEGFPRTASERKRLFKSREFEAHRHYFKNMTARCSPQR